MVSGKRENTRKIHQLSEDGVTPAYIADVFADDPCDVLSLIMLRRVNSATVKVRRPHVAMVRASMRRWVMRMLGWSELLGADGKGQKLDSVVSDTKGRGPWPRVLITASDWNWAYRFVAHVREAGGLEHVKRRLRGREVLLSHPRPHLVRVLEHEQVHAALEVVEAAVAVSDEAYYGDGPGNQDALVRRFMARLFSTTETALKQKQITEIRVEMDWEGIDKLREAEQKKHQGKVELKAARERRSRLQELIGLARKAGFDDSRARRDGQDALKLWLAVASKQLGVREFEDVLFEVEAQAVVKAEAEGKDIDRAFVELMEGLRKEAEQKGWLPQ